ncbi:MAG: dipeptidase [Chlamydiia bacterium]|nr:dipeptidase [Chlamydiia bacterium]
MAIMNLQQLEDYYEEHQQEIVDGYLRFLKFASISSEEPHKEELLACADWICDLLRDNGFTVELWPTHGHPTIFAERNDAGPNAPTVLIYNHYDVQPVDPLELWDSPPFEPRIDNGTVYARGAQDNKGQCWYVLQALKALIAMDGKLPVNVKLCIEGEEEIGSSGLREILSSKADRLNADYLVIADVGIAGPDTPSLTLGCRGIITMDVTFKGSKVDLHSGTHGGLAYNPLHALVEVLSQLRDKEGRITVPGFYDEVRGLTDDQRERISFDFDTENYFSSFEAKPVGGESMYTPLERATIRPTIEINGISGGYSGSGFKTVIPAVASAKISCRLVADQDPKVIGQRVADRTEELAPHGIDVTVNLHSGGGAAVQADPNSKIVEAYSAAYSTVFGKPCKYFFEGGSIPIVTDLARACDAEIVLMGLGLSDDHIHAPNEHFGLDRLKKGFLVTAMALLEVS